MLERLKVLLALVFLFGSENMGHAGQQNGNATTVAELHGQTGERVSVLRLVKFSAALRDSLGRSRSGTIGLTFALYKDQYGGAPLWLETQNALVDEHGNYTVLLGSTGGEGLPLELFATGEARWLGVRVNQPSEEEQPRALLVSVPYALKAADAETLGGKPASAFLLADNLGSRDEVVATTNVDKASLSPVVSALGTLNFVQKQSAAGLEDSTIYDNGKVGIGTTTPFAKLSLGLDLGNTKLALYDGPGDQYGLGIQPGQMRLHVGHPAARFSFLNGAAGSELLTLLGNGRMGLGNTFPLVKLSLGTDLGNTKLALYDLSGDMYGLGIQPGQMRLHVGTPAARFSFLNGTVGSELMTIQGGGNVGIGVVSPSQKLEVNGNLKITGMGNGLMFPDGTLQTVAGGGDITAVIAGTGLIGGATSTDATLSLSPAARVRGITYLAGCDSCSLLTDADDQKTIYQNVIGPMTINSVTCFSDAGSPTINLQRQVGTGTPANILSSDLTCSSTGNTTTNFAIGALSLDDKLDFVMATAGNTAKRVTIVIKTTVN